MAKETTQAAALTPELDGLPTPPKKRGRPASPNPKTAAERKRDSRERQFDKAINNPNDATTTAILETYAWVKSTITDKNKQDRKTILVKLSNALLEKSMML